MFSLKLQDSLIICALAGYFTTHLTLMLTRVKSRLILAADYGRVWWELPDLPVASRPPVSGCNKSKLAVKCWCHCKQSRPPARQGHAVINHQKPYMIWRKFQMFLIYLVFTFKGLKCISEFKCNRWKQRIVRISAISFRFWETS